MGIFVSIETPSEMLLNEASSKPPPPYESAFVVVKRSFKDLFGSPRSG
jgi:hypothetical protein